MANLAVTVVTGNDGSIDVGATLAAFKDALEVYQVEYEMEGEAIANAVHAQFDKYPGASQNMPALVHGALQILGVTPATFGVMEEKVHSWIQENSDRVEKHDRKTKALIQEAEPERTRMFGIRKGRNGGVVRWADQPLKA